MVTNVIKAPITSHLFLFEAYNDTSMPQSSNSHVISRTPYHNVFKQNPNFASKKLHICA